LLRAAASVNAGCQFTRIVRSEAGLSERPKQVFESLEPEEIDRLVGHLKMHLGRFATFGARRLRLIRNSLGMDVAGLFELLDQAFEQPFALLCGHLLEFLADFLGAIVVK
jgi:hypothetical protein